MSFPTSTVSRVYINKGVADSPIVCSDDIAEIYTTIGYLVPIISVLSLAIMPRAKYIQTLLLNTVGICVGSA
jgi:hypothetical protein